MTDPTGDTPVWIAIRRRAVEAHRPTAAGLTGCGRSTRTGHTLTAAQATTTHAARWCDRCWPAHP